MVIIQTNQYNQSPSRHHCLDLVQVFDACFAKQFNTRLVAGGSEPIYLPANKACAYHRIVFTQDYFASALHEIAHWCIAGEQRRMQVDYGYWYAPDGRDATQQADFERAEIKPQAMEWLFNSAAGSRFRLSVDNLAAGFGASGEFAQHVLDQVKRYCVDGVNERAFRFIVAMQRFYQTSSPLEKGQYHLEQLR